MTSQCCSRRVRTQHFGGAGCEIRDHRIHRNSAARDHDAGLPGRPKIHGHAALGECARQSERAVFFAQCAIGAHREQALAGSLAAGGNRNIRRRRAYIDEPAAAALRHAFQLRRVVELGVHAADEIESRFQRLDQRWHPALADHPARVGDADERAHAHRAPAPLSDDGAASRWKPWRRRTTIRRRSDRAQSRRPNAVLA